MALENKLGLTSSADLAKGNFRFAPLMYLQAALDNAEVLAFGSIIF